MTRHRHEELTAGEQLRLGQVAIGCMGAQDIAETLRRMGRCSTDAGKLQAVWGYQIERAQDASGGNCTGCGGHVQVQHRPINKGQVYSAMQFCDYFKAHGLVAGYHYIKPEDVLRSAPRSREMSKLRHWGLVAGMPENPGEPGIPGYRPVLWTICADPDDPERDPPLMRYVEGELKLPHHAVVYHNQFICFKGPLETVHEVEGFSIEEYMDYARKKPGT
jgi:hypothetical protein